MSLRPIYHVVSEGLGFKLTAMGLFSLYNYLSIVPFGNEIETEETRVWVWVLFKTR